MYLRSVYPCAVLYNPADLHGVLTYCEETQGKKPGRYMVAAGKIQRPQDQIILIGKEPEK